MERAIPRLKRENRRWSAVALTSAYLDGAVRRIGEKFRAQTEPIRAAEHHNCKELVLAKEKIIKDYMATAFPNIRMEYGRRRVVSAAAFDKGYSDAGKINLRPGITKEVHSNWRSLHANVRRTISDSHTSSQRYRLHQVFSYCCNKGLVFANPTINRGKDIFMEVDIMKRVLSTTLVALMLAMAPIATAQNVSQSTAEEQIGVEVTVYNQQSRPGQRPAKDRTAEGQRRVEVHGCGSPHHAGYRPYHIGKPAGPV